MLASPTIEQIELFTPLEYAIFLAHNFNAENWKRAADIKKRALKRRAECMKLKQQNKVAS